MGSLLLQITHLLGVILFHSKSVRCYRQISEVGSMSLSVDMKGKAFVTDKNVLNTSNAAKVIAEKNGQNHRCWDAWQKCFELCEQDQRDNGKDCAEGNSCNTCLNGLGDCTCPEFYMPPLPGNVEVILDM